jgi:flagellar protein FliO/FliZ
MSFLDVLGSLIPLIIVTGLLFLLLKYLKKSGFPLKSAAAKSNEIKVISTQMIMPRKYISVIRVRDSFLLIGISDNSITMLKELDYASAEGEEDISGELNTGFLSILKNTIGIK